MSTKEVDMYRRIGILFIILVIILTMLSGCIDTSKIGIVGGNHQQEQTGSNGGTVSPNDSNNGTIPADNNQNTQPPAVHQETKEQMYARKVDEYGKQLREAHSMKGILTFDVPYIGQFETYLLCEDNKTYIADSFCTPEMYEHIVGSNKYIYTHDGENWVRRKEYASPHDTMNVVIYKLTQGDNYDYVEDYNVYVLKRGVDVDFMGLSNIMLMLDEGRFIICGSLRLEGMQIDVYVEFNSFNQVSVTLPTYWIGE